MSRPSTTRPTIKPASEWLREAPAGATALIVAECTSKERPSPSRRVALGWLYGDRNKTEPLRDAARKLPDTLLLATADDTTKRQDSDGSIYLSTSERCHIRWTVRTIPIGLIGCWTGFEDAIAPPMPMTPAAPTPRPAKTAPSVAPTNIQQPLNVPANSKAPTTPLPADPYRPQRTCDATPNYPAALPVFAPLSALIFDKKKALQGNCAAPDGKFITDGRMLLVRDACDKKFVERVKPIKSANHGPENPIADARCQKLFDNAIQDAKYNATICGYVLGASVGLLNEPEQPLVCLRGPGGRVLIVDGHRLLLAQNIAGANHVKLSAEEKPRMAVLFKDDVPVALLMNIDYAQGVATFEKMLEANSRTNITAMQPATAHRKAS